ncbi:MAG: hypothetical protein WA090_07460 [Candidatus Nanopelagicaceae bacterium]
MPLPLLLSISWRSHDDDREPISPNRQFTSRIWIFLVLLLCVSELGNYFWSDFTGSDIKYPTLTVLVDPIVASTAGRIGFVFIWAHLVVDWMALYWPAVAQLGSE